jgi:phage gpG-like protein
LVVLAGTAPWIKRVVIMTTFKIEVNVAAVNAQLARLANRGANVNEVLVQVGTDLRTQIKGFFETGIGADGSPWMANQATTIHAWLRDKQGAFSKTTGQLTKKGRQLATSKKVLTGMTGNLKRQITQSVNANTLTIISNARNDGYAYGRIHQFGGMAGRSGKQFYLPPRPFMPIDSKGNLYPAAAKIINERLIKHLNALNS